VKVKIQRKRTLLVGETRKTGRMDCSTMQSGALSLHLWGCEEDGSGLSSQGFHQALSKLKFKKNDNIRERKKKGKKKKKK